MVDSLFLYEVIDIFRLLLLKSCAGCSWLGVAGAVSDGKMAAFPRCRSCQHLLFSMQIRKISYSSVWNLSVCVYSRCMSTISLAYAKGTGRHWMSFWLSVLVEQSHKVGDFYFVGGFRFNLAVFFPATIMAVDFFTGGRNQFSSTGWIQSRHCACLSLIFSGSYQVCLKWCAIEGRGESPHL